MAFDGLLTESHTLRSFSLARSQNLTNHRLMTIKDFIEETLVQIVQGVHAAQGRIEQSGASINRVGLKLHSDHVQVRRYDVVSMEVEDSVTFDIALTTEAGKEAKGGIGVYLGAVGLGTQGQSNNKESAISRVQFTVPIIYPQSPRKDGMTGTQYGASAAYSRSGEDHF